MSIFDWTVEKDDIKQMEEEIKNNLTHANGLNNNLIERNKKDEIAKDGSDMNIGRTIYPTNGTVKDYNAKYTYTHRLLKYSFITPLLNIFMKKYKDKTVKELPDKYEFQKMNAFNRAYNQALIDWNERYRCLDDKKIKSKEEIEKLMNDKPTEYLRFMKEMVLTICSNDTAYLEFFNMMMLNIKKEMEFIDTQHLMFTDKNINDPKYFLLVDKMTPETIELARKLVNGHIRCVEVVKNETGEVELKVWENEMPRFVKNTDLPKK